MRRLYFLRMRLGSPPGWANHGGTFTFYEWNAERRRSGSTESRGAERKDPQALCPLLLRDQTPKVPGTCQQRTSRDPRIGDGARVGG